MTNPERTLFLGVSLEALLQSTDPLSQEIWLDNCHGMRGLVSGKSTKKKQQHSVLTPALQLC
jgi:hypothetical protein